MNEATQLLQLPFRLRTIYVRESSTKFDEAFDPLKPGQQLSAQFKSAPHSYFVTGEVAEDGVTKVPQSYTFVTRFEFMYMLGDAILPDDPTAPIEGKAVASISADIAVDYLKNPQAPEPTEEEALAWGGGSALLHAWPYWREFCHSSMLRMNLPVLIVPFMVAQHQNPLADTK